jgi:chaperonin cofactor prefoldin
MKEIQQKRREKELELHKNRVHILEESIEDLQWRLKAAQEALIQARQNLETAEKNRK